MDDLLKKLKDCSRLLELEDSIPYWENQVPELKARISEMTRSLKRKEQELLEGNPGNFFQILLGKTTGQKERLSQQIREITSAITASQWELEALEKRTAAGKQELATLAGSRQVYETAKEAAPLTPVQENCLIMEEIAAFAPLALKAAGRVQEALEEAGAWMQQEVLRSEAGNDSRNPVFFRRAAEASDRLRDILSALPEGVAGTGGYLQSSYDYIFGAASGHEQQNRLNMAREQIRSLSNQLRLLLGE